jgi:primosomal protein N' (replication factor Y)
LPGGFAASVRPGSRLLVPFGRQFLTGYAVALHDRLPDGHSVDESAIKDAEELLDEQPLVTEEILRLTKWTADYYAASWGEILKASLPAGINASTERIISITEHGRSALLKVANFKPLKWQLLQELSHIAERPQREFEREYGKAAVQRAIRDLNADELVKLRGRAVTTKVKPKLRKAVRLIADAETASAAAANLGQSAVISALAASSGEIMFSELSEMSGVSASSINTLAKKGIVEVYVRELRRDPLLDSAIPTLRDITLNSEQAGVLAEIVSSVKARTYKAFLLHGVTGSGKTEVYIRAMREALDQGRTALMLVPEIALTPVFSKRLRAVFGDDVAILHSNLSPGERFDEWRRVHSGAARIAIGTRSAIFAPLKDIGLIIVDEEHDTSYRQQESPFYNARDAAVMRASLNNATVVLGTATPALETFHNAKSGKYQYLQMPNRIENRPLAKAELIDMRDVFRQAGKDVAISPQLAEEIEATHRRGEQSIILLNRRGFSTFVLCRSCGETLRCKNCDITLTYHRRDSRMVCHYCGYNARVPQKCPFCSSEFLYFVGEGTEQLEDILVKKFPNLRVARVDRDTMSKKGEMSRILSAFDDGEIDMLVGTQMLAKGHDFHNVTLVGVISVDIGLGLPDFRSAERTFQLLTQVAGRAGRGDLPGRVLIQTYYPEHYALRFACEQDFDGFFAEEVKFRKRLHYPPFVVLASILIKHTDYSVADKNAQILRAALDRANTKRTCQILGPASASIARLKNEFRLQMLVKSLSRAELRDCLDIAAADAESKGADLRCINIEIDPVNLL